MREDLFDFSVIKNFLALTYDCSVYSMEKVRNFYIILKIVIVMMVYALS